MASIAVADHVQIVMHLAVLQGFPGQVDVPGIVFDQKNFNGFRTIEAGCIDTPPSSISKW